jgi:hypothetical protein
MAKAMTGADIPRTESVGVARALAGEDDELADPLLGVRSRVGELRVVRQRALVDPQQVDATGEGVGTGLEDVGEELAVRERLERDLLGLECPVLDR